MYAHPLQMMILDQVKEEDEQDGRDSWFDLTSEELLDCLEKLESLQYLKTSNEDKDQTIDQSAHDEDMQRALEKNPDISKEQSNLEEEGWVWHCTMDLTNYVRMLILCIYSNVAFLRATYSTWQERLSTDFRILVLTGISV